MRSARMDIDTFDADCARGNSVACANAGVWCFRAGEFARALAYFERGCRGGQGAACNRLAHMLLNGEGTDADAPRAERLFRDACAGGDGNSCATLGGLLARRGESAAAEESLQRGCDAGYAPACTTLGVRLIERPVETADHARAAALFQRACDAQDFVGCCCLGVQYATGLGVPKDRERANFLEEHARLETKAAGTCRGLGALSARESRETFRNIERQGQRERDAEMVSGVRDKRHGHG